MHELSALIFLKKRGELSEVENDTLRKISQLKGVALSVLMELNPEITNPDAVISYGRLIRIR